MHVWAILKSSLKNFYEHLFLMVFVSIIGFFIIVSLTYLSISGLYLKQYYWVFLNLFLAGPCIVSVFYFTHFFVEQKECKLKDFFYGFKKYFKKGICAYLLNLVLFLVLMIDLIFFINNGTKLLFYLSGFWLYLLLFLLLCQFYFWSLLVQIQDGIFKTLKKSAILVLDNFGYSLFLLLVFIILTVLGIVTGGVIFVFFYPGFLSLLMNTATYKLLVKYGIKEEVSLLNNIN